MLLENLFKYPRTKISVCLAVTWLLVGTTYAINYPATPTGFVTDTAEILSQVERETINQTLEAYQQETSNEIAVVILPTLEGEPAVDVAIEIGRAWGVGTEEFNNGIVLLIASEDRELFIATGYGLEGAVPDIVAQGVIDYDILPYFRDEEYYQGIMSGIDSLQKHIGGEYTAERYNNYNDGEFSISAGFIFFLIFILQWIVAILGRTKSWWLGGVIGGVIGFVIFAIWSWLLAIPVIAVLGLALDYLVSKNHKSNSKTKWWAGGGWGPGGFGGGSSGGGFSGFSGGSFGGGGAGGKW